MYTIISRNLQLMQPDTASAAQAARAASEAQAARAALEAQGATALPQGTLSKVSYLPIV